MEAEAPSRGEPLLMGWEEGEINKLLYTAAAVATVFVFIVIHVVFTTIQWVNKEPIIEYFISTPKRQEDATFSAEQSIRKPGSTAIHCYAPATGEFLGTVEPSTPEGIDAAIEKTKIAQDKWVRTTFSQRRQVLRCIQAFIMQNQEEISRIACIDSGKTMVDATLGEILVTVEKLRWTILHGEKALKPSRRPTNLLMAYKKNTVQYEPLGIVAALVSWNYPVHNLIGPMISAIFSGNGIIVKASENTAWSANYFTLIVKAALHVCGHDPHIVQTVITWPETANHLTSHPDISHVTFIGSRPVAKLVAAAAAKSLTPIVPELGGKDAAILLDTAMEDLPRIVEILLRGTFQASGQNCIGIERIIGCPRVYDKLVLALEPRIKALRVGSILDDDEVDVGAMISDASFDRLEKLIQGAVKDGARLLVGGKRYQHPDHRYGHYFQPTLLVDVTKDMAIANEECFGPICVLMRAKRPEDACEIANAPDFGLGASVFGEYGYTMEAMVRNLKTGMVAVNDFAAYYAVQLPFGGVRGSGYGRFAGEEGLRGLCNVKAVCEDRFGWAGVSTAIPPRIRYPIPDTDNGYEFVRSVTEIGYGMGVKGRIGGLRRMWKNK